MTLLDGSKAPHSVLFQPWTGFVRTADRVYVQGVTSLLVPTDESRPDVVEQQRRRRLLRLPEPGARWLTAVAPTAELHVRTPLPNRNPNDLVFLQDQVNVTGGLHLRFNRVAFNSAVRVPVVGPRGGTSKRWRS